MVRQSDNLEVLAVRRKISNMKRNCDPNDVSPNDSLIPSTEEVDRVRARLGWSGLRLLQQLEHDKIQKRRQLSQGSSMIAQRLKTTGTMPKIGDYTKVCLHPKQLVEKHLANLTIQSVVVDIRGDSIAVATKEGILCSKMGKHLSVYYFAYEYWSIIKETYLIMDIDLISLQGKVIMDGFKFKNLPKTDKKDVHRLMYSTSDDSAGKKCKSTKCGCRQTRRKCTHKCKCKCDECLNPFTPQYRTPSHILKGMLSMVVLP